MERIPRPWIMASVFAAASALPWNSLADAARMERFRVTSPAVAEAPLPDHMAIAGTATQTRPPVSEAPTGFDNRTNGFLPQGPAFETINEDNVVPLRSFNDNRFIFEEVETVADGLGPTYNAQSCRECHQNVVTGGASQIAEHRTGRMGDGQCSSSRWAAR